MNVIIFYIPLLSFISFFCKNIPHSFKWQSSRWHVQISPFVIVDQIQFILQRKRVLLTKSCIQGWLLILNGSIINSVILHYHRCIYDSIVFLVNTFLYLSVGIQSIYTYINIYASLSWAAV